MAKKTLRIKPVEGRRIMFHDNPGRVIDSEREVPWHPHYTRAIARGDLAEVKASKKPSKRSGSKED